MSPAKTNRPDPPDAFVIPRNRTWAIFWVSVLGLFLEMLLIRWIGTEIRIFAYLQNTVLVVCFLGLGMGCFTCRKPIRINRLLVSLVTLTTLLAMPFTRAAMGKISELLSVLGDLVIWGQAISQSPAQTMWHVSLGLGGTFCLMVLLWEMFVPLGRILGRLMDDHPHTIRAYSVNVAGSLIGIWLFVLLSALYMPPVVWFLAAAGMMWLFVGRGPRRMTNLAMLATTVVLAWFAGLSPGAMETTWSPYQKLVMRPIELKTQKFMPGQYLINVNNTSYQGMIDLSDEGVKADPRIDPDMRGLSQYDVPLLLKPNPDRVLIVGAGSGNDAAGALRGGAGHVTAVEIDPAIIEMGRRHHPERPYDSPNVTVVNDDARSFFATTEDKYDLIIFGLLDSHTMNAMTNARLDHYVYTRESLRRAKSLLAEGGVMVLSFEAAKQFITDRMARCLYEEFNCEPITFRIPTNGSGWGGAIFVTGDQQVIRESLANNTRLAQQIDLWNADNPVRLTYTASVITDDWPYVYLEHARIPMLYYLLAFLMAGLLFYGAKRLKTPGLIAAWNRSHWHFFFLGAAFLLLEVQNISKAAVVLGNTWSVNAVIISGILLMILLANLIAARFPRIPQDLVTLGLIGSCLALYFIDLSRFAFLPYLTKAAIVGTLTTLPMLFAGIIFIRSFAAVKRKDVALGANLIGALVGGLLQSITFVVGIKALLLIVGGLYMAALLTRPRVGAGEMEDREEEWAEKPMPVELVGKSTSPNTEPDDDEADPAEELAEPVGV